MRPKNDILGKKFGKWTVIAKADAPVGYERLQYWLCQCDCGKQQVRKGAQLNWAEKKGIIQSCSDCARISHGMTKTPEYRIWLNMRDRCFNPRSHAYKRYGERGIKVCDRWNKFENFIADMGKRPSSKHSIDRIDNDSGYAPENCRWATSIEQTRNQSNTVMLTFNGQTKCIMEWANILGASHAVLWNRINILKWPVDVALSTEVGPSKNWRNTPHKDAIRIEYKGEKKTINEWSKEFGIPSPTIRGRIARGCKLDDVFKK